MGNRTYMLLILALVVSGGAVAADQQAPCTQAVPVNVMLPDAGLVRKLPPEGFVAHNKSGPVQIQALADDSGPRRIIFVVENSKAMPAAARQIEASVISAILATGRAEDSFAFFTARGPEMKIQFGATRASLLAAAQELRNPPKGKTSPGGILDALVEATSWFHQPQPGDAIFLMTMGLENPSQASFSKARELVEGARVRVFGFLLGGYIAGYYSDSIGMSLATGGMYLPVGGISPNTETIFALGQVSGGLIGQENTTFELRQYKLTDDRLRFLERQGVQMYKAITEYYSLQLAAMNSETVVDLAEPIRQKLPRAMVLYPRAELDCGQRR